MSSVTAVPLQPIRKGSVLRLWLGVLVVVAAAALLVWVGLRPFGHTSSGLSYTMLKEGTGPSPARDDFVLVTYKGMLPNGKVFDETQQPTPMDLTTMIPGFAEAVTLMKKDGKMRVRIPANLAYGSEPKGDLIPANSPLVFEIGLREFRTRAEIMELQRQQQMQQMLQQQQGGAPQGMVVPPQGPPQLSEGPPQQP